MILHAAEKTWTFTREEHRRRVMEAFAPLRCNVTGVVIRQPEVAWERNRERQRLYRERVRATAAKTLAETVAADG
jgi:hypothetical protein